MKIQFRWTARMLSASIAVAAHAQSNAAEPTHLRFAWPDNLVAHVKSQRLRYKQVDEQAAVKTSMDSRYVMRSQRKGDQYVLSFSDLQLDPVQLAAMPTEQRVLMDVATKAALPSFAVSREGTFVSVDNLNGFQSAMRSAFATLMPDAGLQARLRPVLDTILSEAVLKSMIETEWNWKVGAWTGAENGFDPGDEYVVTTRAVMPVVNAQLTQHTRFSVARTLPCERQGKRFECVELRSTTTPDEADARKAVEAFAGRLTPNGAPEDALKLEALTYETRLELVTETETLITHRYKLIKTVVMTSIESGKSRTMRQVEETEQTFQYRPQD